MRSPFVLFFTVVYLIVCLDASAQTNKSWAVGFNPFSIGEPHIAIGPCAEYSFSSRLSVWGELSYIFHNNYLPAHWKDVQGFRSVFQLRYHIGNSRSFFIAPEGRIKFMSFVSYNRFFHTTIPDSSIESTYKESQLLSGGAIVFGKELWLSRKKNLLLQITIGIGAKYRHIMRNDPDGYYFKEDKYAHGVAHGPRYDANYAVSPHFPAGLRLMWRLK